MIAMIHFRKPKVKLNYNKKALIIGTVLSTILLLSFFPLNFYADLKQIISGAIAFLIRGIGDGISSLLKEMNMNLDKLIFNADGGFSDGKVLSDMNLTLLKNNNVSTQLFKLYTLFLYIAASFLGCVGLWITFDFKRSADDAKHVAILKDRLKKLILSIVLMGSIPTIFDILMTFNQTFVDVFRTFIIDNTSNINTSGPFLMDTFYQMSKQEGDSIILALIYVMSGFLNVWLIFFYMIRDLTIAFLFLIAPMLALLLPYRADLMLTWLKEMSSNIFTQAVQAMVLSVILAIASTAGSGTLYEKLFCLASFAMFIPLTSTMKKMLGLEGEMGAAKSNAGLGAAMGAMALAGGAIKGISNRAGRVKASVSDLQNITAEENLLNKSRFGETSVSGSAVATKVGGGNAISSGGRGN